MTPIGGAVLLFMLGVTGPTAVTHRADSEDAKLPWGNCGIGSWVLVEWRVSGSTAPRTYQVTTTLAGSSDHARYFKHRNSLGQRFENGERYGYLFPELGATRDTTVREEYLIVDRQSFRCQVMRTVGTIDSNTYDSSEEWLSSDFPRLEGVLKRVSVRYATSHQDGRVVTSTDSTVWQVVRLNERLHIGHRAVDCVVATTKSRNGTLTEWACEDVPTHWARTIDEAVDPKTGATTRTENVVLDFQVRH